MTNTDPIHPDLQASIIEEIEFGVSPESAGWVAGLTSEDVVFHLKSDAEFARAVSIAQQKAMARFERSFYEFAQHNASAAAIILESRYGYNRKAAQMRDEQGLDEDIDLEDLDLGDEEGANDGNVRD